MEDQQNAGDRIPSLLDTPAAIRFISAEPLLGPVNLHGISVGGGCYLDALTGAYDSVDPEADLPPIRPGLDWVICGGESGPGARPTHPDWVRLIRDQCQHASVPFFWKQWGEWFPGVLEVSDDGPPWNRAYPDIEHDPTADGWEGHWRYHEWPGGEGMLRVGKKRAGRMLDKRTWDDMPARAQ